MEVNDMIDDVNLFSDIESIHLGGDDSSEINSNQNIFHDVLSEVSLKDEKHLSPSDTRSVSFQTFKYIALTPRSYLSSRITSPAILTTVPHGIAALNLSLSDWDSPQSTVNLFSSNDAYSEITSDQAKNLSLISPPSPPSSLTRENLRKHQKSLEQNEPISPSNSISTIKPDQSSPTRKSGGNTNNSSVQRFVLYEKVLSQLKSIKLGSRSNRSAYSSFYQNTHSIEEISSQQLCEITVPTISASLSRSYDQSTVTNQEIIEEHYSLPCNPDDISDSSQQNYSPTSPSSLIAGSENYYRSKNCQDFVDHDKVPSKSNKLFPFYIEASELVHHERNYVKQEEKKVAETSTFIPNIPNAINHKEEMVEVEAILRREPRNDEETVPLNEQVQLTYDKEEIYSVRENHILFFKFLKILSTLTVMLIAFIILLCQPVFQRKELILIPPRSSSPQTETFNFSKYTYSKQGQFGDSNRSSFEPPTSKREDKEESDQYLKSLRSLYFTETSMKTVSVYLPQRTVPTTLGTITWQDKLSMDKLYLLTRSLDE